MKKRKSQVTIFIIIGLVIFLILVITILFSNMFNIRDSILYGSVNNDIEKINLDLETCIQEKSIDAIRVIAVQGGYFSLPKEYIETPISNVGYGIIDNKLVLRSLTDIEKDIENYIDLTMPYCINQQNYNGILLKTEFEKSNVEINDETIEISLGININGKVNKENFIIDKEFISEIDIGFGRIYSVANKIIARQLIEKDYINMNYLVDFEEDIMFIPKDKNNIIFIITDNKSKINGIPLSFVFGVKIP